MLATKLAPPFAPYAETFSRTCYDTIFQWIPRYKEAGFSTFRFEDFLDGRVRQLVPSLRSQGHHRMVPTAAIRSMMIRAVTAWR